MKSAHSIGSGRALFALPGDRFIQATRPLTPIGKEHDTITKDKKETTMGADPFDNWRRALAGEKQPIYELEPWVGYFAVQDRSPNVTTAKGNKWPLIACAIFEQDGQLCAERAGKSVPVEWVWPYAASRPITYEDYVTWHATRQWPEKEKAA